MGNSVAERTGDRIFLRTILLKYIPNLNEMYIANGVQMSCLYRVVLIYDNRPTGIKPDVTDIFDGTHIISNYRWENRSRFTPLYDKTHRPPVNAFAPSGLGPTDFWFQMNPPVTSVRVPVNKPVVYKPESTNSDYGDFVSGAIYIIFFSLRPSLDPITLNYRHSLSFTDSSN